MKKDLTETFEVANGSGGLWYPNCQSVFLGGGNCLRLISAKMMGKKNIRNIHTA